jgi:hypothetical protein
LVVVDTGSQLSLFGQLVALLLIQETLIHTLFAFCRLAKLRS